MSDHPSYVQQPCLKDVPSGKNGRCWKPVGHEGECGQVSTPPVSRVVPPEPENVLSSPMASALLLKLKAECEAQYARANKAETERDGLEQSIADFNRTNHDHEGAAEVWHDIYVEQRLRAEKAEADLDIARQQLQEAQAEIATLQQQRDALGGAVDTLGVQVGAQENLRGSDLRRGQATLVRALEASESELAAARQHLQALREDVTAIMTIVQEEPKLYRRCAQLLARHGGTEPTP